MKRILSLLLSASAFIFFSCSKEVPVTPEEVVPQGPNVITRNGSVDGVAYSLSGLALNPGVVVLNADNSELLSSASELSEGVVKVRTGLTFAEADVLYIRSGNYTGLRKVSAIARQADGSYVLQTEPAQLGELFEGGAIDLSLDLYEMTRATYGFDRSFEILNVTGQYDRDGLVYNPATNVRLAVNMQMEFKKSQLLPSRFATSFEILPTMNPSLTFAGSVNRTYSTDMVQYIPVELIEFLKKQEFNFDIPINALGIESLPAKLRIEDIKMPTRIEANLSDATHLAFGVNGSLKAGYEIAFNGLRASTKPIYESTITTIAPDATLDVPGELLTNAEIVITPAISVLDDLYKVSGDIVFGLKTETAGGMSLPGSAPTFASKGLFTSRMTVLVDLILTQVPIDIINTEKELWSTGALDKTVVYSDLSWKVSKNYSTDLLLTSRKYETDFTLNYKYPILGKRLPEELLISYEVYQDNGKTRIVSVTDQVIVPTNVTADSFKFKLDIPYKTKLLMITFQTTSYLKNIVIRDRNGYVYEGIYNTAKGVNENSFTIKQ